MLSIIVLCLGMVVVDARSGVRRAAECDVQPRAIRARSEASRPFAERNRRDDVQRRGVDDGEVARRFVCDVDPDFRHLRRCRSGDDRRSRRRRGLGL